MALTSKMHFKIGSTEFIAQEMNLEFESISTDDSGRSEDGVMHNTFLRTNMIKLSIKMPPMSYSDVYNILSKVQGQQYSITYWDPTRNAERTATVYTSTSSADCYSGVVLNGLYQGVSFNAIEV